MKNILIIIFLAAICQILNAQKIYSKDYGDKNNPPIIFIHGGPSGNSNLFEETTAENLANKGFYLIVYDRRGEGRSKDENAKMTFNESFDDLLEIYKIYKIEKANILAHSFGGIIATLFTEKNPEKVKSLILAGALFSQQETYNHILKSAKSSFQDNKNKILEISKVENLSKNSAEYRKSVYDIASEMNFFDMPNPTTESENLRKKYMESDIYKANFRNQNSPLKFYKNETRNNVDNKTILKKIKKNKIPIYAIYGENDQIFSKKQFDDLQKIVGRDNFKILENCSHYLFVDQQQKFLNFITEKIK